MIYELKMQKMYCCNCKWIFLQTMHQWFTLKMQKTIFNTNRILDENIGNLYERNQIYLIT